MTNAKSKTTRSVVFVDLDNPPATIQLNVGDELALVRTTAAGSSFISAVNVPTPEFGIHPNMCLMVPLAMIRLPGQPVNTCLVHHGIAQKTGKGKVTFAIAPPNPTSPGGANHSLPYDVV